VDNTSRSLHVHFATADSAKCAWSSIGTRHASGKRRAALRRDGETDRGAPRVRRGKAAWNLVDCYAGRVETLFHAVYGRPIIDFHCEPIKARPLAVPNARAIAVPDIDSQVVVIAARR